jgi:hypothetical protein
LRARGRRRKRDGCNEESRKTGQCNGSKHLATSGSNRVYVIVRANAALEVSG